MDTMQSIGRDQDYGRRLARPGNDELGILVDEFNEMLAAVERRDEELTSYRKGLEKLVEERTQELERTQ